MRNYSLLLELSLEIDEAIRRSDLPILKRSLENIRRDTSEFR
jgi:hypothetical protein